MSGNARLELFGNVLPPVAHVDLIAPEGVDLERGISLGQSLGR